MVTSCQRHVAVVAEVNLYQTHYEYYYSFPVFRGDILELIIFFALYYIIYLVVCIYLDIIYLDIILYT